MRVQVRQGVWLRLLVGQQLTAEGAASGGENQCDNDRIFTIMRAFLGHIVLVG